MERTDDDYIITLRMRGAYSSFVFLFETVQLNFFSEIDKFMKRKHAIIEY